MSGSNLKSWPKELGYPKTCPMSRHAAMIANGLRDKRKGGYGRVLRDAGYEVDHMADTLEMTVIELWKARGMLEWDGMAQDWVPINQSSEVG